MCVRTCSCVGAHARVCACGVWGGSRRGVHSGGCSIPPDRLPYSNLHLIAARFDRTSVDLAAPGSFIYSTYPRALLQNLAAHASLSGTSMATPFVAGAAALLQAAVPGITPTCVRLALLDRADVVPGLDGRVVLGVRGMRTRFTCTVAVSQGASGRVWGAGRGRDDGRQENG